MHVATVGKIVSPITYNFADWLNQVAEGRRDSVIANAYRDLEDLRPKREGADRRSDRRRNPVRASAPRQDVGKWRNGQVPGYVRAYRLGRALEQLGAPCNGIDALIAADRWPDAIGCIGEFLFDYDMPPIEWEEEGKLLRAVFSRKPYAKPLPGNLYPAMDAAWLHWISGEKDTTHMRARIQAGYALANSEDPQDRAIAEQILFQWEPLGGLYVNRKVRRLPSLR